MACFKPRPVAYLFARNPKTGNRIVLYTIPEGLSPRFYEKIFISCRQCSACRLKYSSHWATRIVHETSLFEDSSFITLTYSNDKLPLDFSLNYDHFQLFMKRFRSYVNSRSHFKKFGFYCDKVRFFMCGEYGDEFGRPHFHAGIFGYDFVDKYYYASSNGFPLYRSDTLDKLWTDPDDGINYGTAYIGSVTYQSAGYIARYCMKKRTGKIAPEYYKRLHIDEDTGEILHVYDLQPEFSHQSTNPGIGAEWYNKYAKTDLYVRDSVFMNGAHLTIPRYYDNKFKLEFGDDFEEIKAKRKAEALKNASDVFDWNRLAVLEEVQLAKAKLLKRNYL